MNDVAIKVSGLYKSFKLPHEQRNSVKSLFLNVFNGRRTFEKQQVLRDINFEVKKGEFFGIVGRNGSGKSTLLKLLSGIYAPDDGSIIVNGKLTPFIELGVGFSPELTGRENVFLNGSLLGFNRSEMEAMYDEIVNFAELEKFMDQKLKNYSSGMQVRLAFSIAIRANTDILILDEVLAVGDAAFQQKCFDYFEALKKNEKTIVIVTHDMSAVKRFCSRAVLIEDGDIKVIGSPDEVADQYLFDNLNTDAADKKSDKKSLTPAIKSLNVKVHSVTKLKDTDTLKFDVEYELNEDIDVYLGYSIMYQGISIAEHNSKSVKLGSAKGVKHVVSYDLPLINFNTNPFKMNVSIFNLNNGEPLGYKIDACSFLVSSDDATKGGPVQVDGTWAVKK